MGFKVRNFKKRLKRNGDAVLSLHSPKGIEGGILVSGSGDSMIIVWDLLKKKRITKTELHRPTDEYLLSFTDDKMVNYSEEHILNT